MNYLDSAMVTGIILSINVGKRGVEINVTNPEVRAEASEDRPYYTCRIDRSSANTGMILELATSAMLNYLTVILCGIGDDRDDTLEFDELRVVGTPQSA